MPEDGSFYVKKSTVGPLSSLLGKGGISSVSQ